MRVFHSPGRQALHAPSGEPDGGRLVPPRDDPGRPALVLEALAEAGMPAGEEPRRFGLEPLEAVHRADLLEFLAGAWGAWRAAGMEGEILPGVWPGRSMAGRTGAPRAIEGRVGFHALAGDTPLVEGSWEAARASADCALAAAEAAAGGERLSFALCRPPGHHASSFQYGGYCLLNNAAAAAQALRAAGASRVAVLDVDFHHGNGTQEIFWRRGDVLYASVHGDPEDAFPHFLGYADEAGEGEGEGATLNLPLPPGSGGGLWAEALAAALARVASFGAEALVVSLGVDAHRRDPLGFFALGESDFREAGRACARAGLPMVAAMEGGYDLESLGPSVAAFLRGALEEG